MGRPKEVLRSCGVETAKRLRRCRGKRGHVIPAGCRCLVFRENLREKSYCRDCAVRLLERGRDRVDALLAEVLVEELEAEGIS
ncbi:MAG: hypothetical protein KDB18_12540 [Salinibacterium sp.]|nr:hypothetical protein [Salinibacterium sp.]